MKEYHFFFMYFHSFHRLLNQFLNEKKRYENMHLNNVLNNRLNKISIIRYWLIKSLGEEYGELTYDT